jgi:vanadium chloroperoxidase
MADSILFWNEVALEANRCSHTDLKLAQQTGPTLSSRALAIIHLAMYDAYAGAVNDPATLPPYLSGLPAVPAGASPLAAVAGAAYTTLVDLYSAQQTFFDDSLTASGALQADPGFAFGVQVARALLLDRSQDPMTNNDPYDPTTERFHHREDPDNPNQGFLGARYGRARNFAVTTRHNLQAPPNNGAGSTTKQRKEYESAVRQVRVKGIKPELMGTLPDESEDLQRTPEETVIGIYWGYDGAIGLGTPPRLYNLIIRRVAQAKGNSEAENAVLFALVNAAMGDAGILSWEQKYTHNFWRPVVGIREHDPSFGPGATEGRDDISANADPQWLPLGAPKSNVLNERFAPATRPLNPPGNNAAFGEEEARIDAAAAAAPPPPTMEEVMRNPRFLCASFLPCLTLGKNFTPNFPAYPSGHATFGAAAFQMARLVFGVKPKDRKRDTLTEGLDFISEEFFSGNERYQGKFFENRDVHCIAPEQQNKGTTGTQDNFGTVRPTHRRAFKDGFWQMIIENAVSRVFLGVHWVFDAFAVKGDADKNEIEPDLKRNVGGVPLGLNIAEDIYENFRQARQQGRNWRTEVNPQV